MSSENPRTPLSHLVAMMRNCSQAVIGANTSVWLEVALGWTTQQIKRKEAILISPSCRKGVWLWERYRGIFGGSSSLSLGARHRGYNIGQMANHETFNKTLSTPVDLHCTMCTSACLICGGKTLPLAHHCVHLCCGCSTRSNPIQSKSDSKQAVVIELHESSDPPTHCI